MRKQSQVELADGQAARSGENSDVGSVAPSIDAGDRLGHNQFLKGIYVLGHVFMMKAG